MSMGSIHNSNILCVYTRTTAFNTLVYYQDNKPDKFNDTVLFLFSFCELELIASQQMSDSAGYWA